MWKKQMVIGLIGVLLALPLPVRAAEVVIQTASDAFEAQDGESGTNATALARITVLVTYNGKIVDNLGVTTGSETVEIPMPSGWALTVYNYPLASCAFVPVRFINEGDGVYTVEVLPPPDTPVCQWHSGEYSYVIRIDKRQYRGSALGRLTIP